MEAESRFASSNAQDFEALVANKDSENTKKSIMKAITITIINLLMFFLFLALL